MMNIKLNLLSPFKKNKLSALTRFLFAKELLEVIIFTCALLAIVFLLGWLILINNMGELTKSALLINKEYPVANQEVRQINAALKEVAAAGEEYHPLLPYIQQVSGLLPDDIKLAVFDLNRSSDTLTLSGTAQTRAALLNFQEIVDKIEWIEGATLPTSQLLQKENIGFEIKTKLKGFPPLKKATAPPKPRSNTSN